MSQENGTICEKRGYWKEKTEAARMVPSYSVACKFDLDKMGIVAV